MDDLRIRLADPETDAAAVAGIYAPAVNEGVASFEADAPDATEMARRITVNNRWAPWLVAAEPHDQAERVVGYAYAVRHAERAAYRWAVNMSVYVAGDRQGRGIGRRLYDVLVPIVRTQGFVHAYAGITLPNPASVALHHAIGMRPFATYQHVGWKHGRWWDVAWLEMPLVSELPQPPAEPTPLPDLLADPDGRARFEELLRR
jgi:phosphinothricin acetyltransferase